jgi:hypothetical protein
MAYLNGNDFYTAIDGTDVSAHATDYELTPGINGEDVTTGSGTDHEQMAEGLRTTKLTLKLSYLVGGVSTYIQKLAPGIHEIEIGPEGRNSGKPRHVQSFLIESTPHSLSVKKKHVTFDVSATGADMPTVDMMAGGAYS